MEGRRTNLILLLATAVLLVVGILIIWSGIWLFSLPARVNAEIAAIKAKGQPTSAPELVGGPVPAKENAAVIYERAFNLISDPVARKALDALPDPRKIEKDPAKLRQAEQTVAKYSNAIDLVQEATNRPKCKFPIDWTADPLEIKFPHLSPLRELGRLLSASATLSTRDGKMSEALEQIEIGFKMSESIADEPSIISQLVRVAIIDHLSDGLERVLDQGSVDEEEARRLFNLLGRIDLNPGFLKAAEGERAMHLSVLSQAFPFPRPSGIFRLWRSADELAYLRSMNEWIEVMGMPYREAEASGRLDEIDRLPRYAIMTAILTPVFSSVSEMRDKGTAQIAGSRVFLAVHAYKSRFHSYPETLDQLKSRLGWKLPEDPFSGKDFIYRRLEKGFVLYSIGPDLQDSGGRPAKESHKANEGDIIWKTER